MEFVDGAASRCPATYLERFVMAPTSYTVVAVYECKTVRIPAASIPEANRVARALYRGTVHGAVRIVPINVHFIPVAR